MVTVSRGAPHLGSMDTTVATIDLDDENERPTIPALRVSSGLARACALVKTGDEAKPRRRYRPVSGHVRFDHTAESFFASAGDALAAAAGDAADEEISYWWAAARRRALAPWVGAIIALCVVMLIASAVQTLT